ncbi:hypothetical protein D7X33_22500 [Butyricicoccus sp. 1XD8-22]|nr:hypothetical protein D7X33_22500 [Butyricicoccus sp. 1XD8-22]
MEERFAYGLNPKKLGAVSSHLCDPATAAAEFLLVKSEYQAATARPVERGALFFQIRQAFPPGEVTADEANKLGFETAMRRTKGKYQFFVCTHTDKGHIHNHIYFNSTAFDCSRKFHNFLGSSFALRRLSDRVCLEHDLSVIQNPKQHSRGRFLHYGQWIGDKPPSAQQRVRLAIIAALEKKPADFAAFLRLMEESGFAVKRGRGGVVSFLAPGQDKYTRLRASTLGVGFDPEDIRAVIAGERPLPELPKDAPPPPRQVGLIIDIQQRMAEGKGPAYERWAKIFNLKEAAKTLNFLMENGLTDYDELALRAAQAEDGFSAASQKIKQLEARMAGVAQLKTHIIQYSKTREVFAAYKKSRHKKEFLAEHGAEIAQHEAAKKAFDALDGKAIPKTAQLSAEYAALLEEKREQYEQYKALRQDMITYQTALRNVDKILGLEPPEQAQEKEQPKPER